MRGEELVCLRCWHSWKQRGDGPPDVCPKCKSRLWNVPKRTSTQVFSRGSYHAVHENALVDRRIYANPSMPGPATAANNKVILALKSESGYKTLTFPATNEQVKRVLDIFMEGEDGER